VSTFVEDDVGQTAPVQNALDITNSTPCPRWTGLNASILGIAAGGVYSHRKGRLDQAEHFELCYLVISCGTPFTAGRP